MFSIFRSRVVNRGRRGVSATITRSTETDASSMTDGSPGSVIIQPNFVYPGNYSLVFRCVSLCTVLT